MFHNDFAHPLEAPLALVFSNFDDDILENPYL
jgi:hypothetical protein